MIKDIQLYPEMANPQLRPRYSGLNWVGDDVVAISPPFDTSRLTAQSAAKVLFEILCVLALAFKQRQGAL